MPLRACFPCPPLFEVLLTPRFLHVISLPSDRRSIPRKPTPSSEKRDPPWQRSCRAASDLLDPSPLDVESGHAHGLARGTLDRPDRGSHTSPVASTRCSSTSWHGRAGRASTARRHRAITIFDDAPKYVIGDMISPFRRDRRRLQLSGRCSRRPSAFRLPVTRTEHIRAYQTADRGGGLFEATRHCGFSAGEAVAFSGRRRLLSPRSARLLRWSAARAEKDLELFNALSRADHRLVRGHETHISSLYRLDSRLSLAACTTRRGNPREHIVTLRACRPRAAADHISRHHLSSDGRIMMPPRATPSRPRACPRSDRFVQRCTAGAGGLHASRISRSTRAPSFPPARSTRRDEAAIASRIRGFGENLPCPTSCGRHAARILVRKGRCRRSRSLVPAWRPRRRTLPARLECARRDLTPLGWD